MMFQMEYKVLKLIFTMIFWVSFPIYTHSQTTPNSICPESFDLVVILDSSGSIRDNNPPDKSFDNWNLILSFVARFMDYFDISSSLTSGVRVAAVSFSNQAKVEFNFHTDKTTLKGDILNTQFQGGNTNTSGAIKLASKDLFFHESKGDRLHVNDVILTITDGHSTWDNKSTLPNAKAARDKGIRMYTIGVTNSVNVTEIKGMSSQPQLENITYWLLPDFKQLETVVLQIVQQICVSQSFITNNIPYMEETTYFDITTDSAITTKIPTTVQLEAGVCPELFDLVVILDNSGSIRDHNPADKSFDNWDLTLSFVARLMDLFHITSSLTSGVRVAAISFSNKAKVEFNFHTNRNVLKKDIMDTVYQGGHTNTSGAIKVMANDLFFHDSKGDRLHVKNVALIITDGHSTWDNTSTLPNAKAARDKGIEMFTIGVTNRVNVTEVKGMSSQPQLENITYWLLPDFTQLEIVVQQIVQQICVSQAATNITKLVPTQQSTPAGSSILSSSTILSTTKSNSISTLTPTTKFNPLSTPASTIKSSPVSSPGPTTKSTLLSAAATTTKSSPLSTLEPTTKFTPLSTPVPATKTTPLNTLAPTTKSTPLSTPAPTTKFTPLSKPTTTKTISLISQTTTLKSTISTSATTFKPFSSRTTTHDIISSTSSTSSSTASGPTTKSSSVSKSTTKSSTPNIAVSSTTMLKTTTDNATYISPAVATVQLPASQALTQGMYISLGTLGILLILFITAICIICYCCLGASKTGGGCCGCAGYCNRCAGCIGWCAGCGCGDACATCMDGCSSQTRLGCCCGSILCCNWCAQILLFCCGFCCWLGYGRNAVYPAKMYVTDETQTDTDQIITAADLGGGTSSNVSIQCSVTSQKDDTLAICSTCYQGVSDCVCNRKAVTSTIQTIPVPASTPSVCKSCSSSCGNRCCVSGCNECSHTQCHHVCDQCCSYDHHNGHTCSCPCPQCHNAQMTGCDYIDNEYHAFANVHSSTRRTKCHHHKDIVPERDHRGHKIQSHCNDSVNFSARDMSYANMILKTGHASNSFVLEIDNNSSKINARK